MIINTQMVLAALKALAGMCDGAAARDNVGFNGRHTAWGHELASKASLSFRQALSAVDMLRTYKNTQLPSLGFDFNELAKVTGLLVEYVIEIDGAEVKARIIRGLPDQITARKVYKKFKYEFTGKTEVEARELLIAELRAYNLSGNLRQIAF